MALIDATKIQNKTCAKILIVTATEAILIRHGYGGLLKFCLAFVITNILLIEAKKIVTCLLSIK